MGGSCIFLVIVGSFIIGDNNVSENSTFFIHLTKRYLITLLRKIIKYI